MSGRVVTWGDWGYAVQSFRGDTRVELLRPAGTTVEPGSIIAVNTNYRTLPVFGDPAQAPEAAIIDVEAGVVAALDLDPNAFLVLVSPVLRRAAWMVQKDSSEAELRIQGFDDAAPDAIAMPPAQILDWSPDGRLVALQATTSRVDDDVVFRSLLVVEVDTGTVYEIALERGDVIGAAIRSTP